MRHLAILLTLLLVPSSVLAVNRTVKVRGVIELCGTDECGIGRLSPYYAFRPNSKISKKIFAKCVPGDECEMTGVVDGKGFFVSVSRVRLIDTNVEPSANVLTDAACWFYSLNCEDRGGSFYVDYVDIVRIKNEFAGENSVWRVEFVVHGVENFVHIILGPGEVYLKRRIGTWCYFKTKP